MQSLKSRLIVILLIFSCVVFISNPTIALAAETDVSNISIETDLDSNNSSEHVEITSETILDVLDSDLTITSFVISILLPSIILLLWGKELPKKHIPLYAFFLLAIISVYRLLIIFLGDAELVGTIYLIILFVLILVLWFKIYNRYIVKKEDTEDEDADIEIDPNSRIEAKKYLKKYIKSSPAAIESIQLYSYIETTAAGKTEYRLEYIDGVQKRGVEINALLGLNLELDEETLNSVKAIIKLYNEYNEGKDIATLETRREMLNSTITECSSQIKQKLTSIVQPELISTNDCCLARVLLVYCSILASLRKETTFVGFGENSLGLSPEIEKSLFTLKRTGTLGAILLQSCPYGFYYNRSGNKTGRTYCSFVCKSNSTNYLVLTAFRMPNGAIAPDIGVSRALANVKEKLTKILGNAPKKEGVTI